MFLVPLKKRRRKAALVELQVRFVSQTQLQSKAFEFYHRRMQSDESIAKCCRMTTPDAGRILHGFMLLQRLSASPGVDLKSYTVNGTMHRHSSHLLTKEATHASSL